MDEKDDSFEEHEKKIAHMSRVCMSARAEATSLKLQQSAGGADSPLSAALIRRFQISYLLS
jgi:hypothetical protein